MDFVSSRETLDFLSQSAPRPWVKRMLLWMIYCSDILAYCEKARSVAWAFAALQILHTQEKERGPEGLRDKLLKHFDLNIVEQIINGGENNIVEEIVFDSTDHEEMREVAPGYFVFAQSIDWESGSLDIEIQESDIDSDLFDHDDELRGGSLENPNFKIRLEGLCFQREQIEMLQPSFELGPTTKRTASSKARVGRPRTWDWDAATLHLLNIAQTPDGLPTGAGAQAQIERLLADWFADTYGDAPSESQIRTHAQKAMRATARRAGPKSP